MEDIWSRRFTKEKQPIVKKDIDGVRIGRDHGTSTAAMADEATDQRRHPQPA